MQADEFKQIAIDIFGDGWSYELAEIFKINRRTVRDYAKGLRTIPEPIAGLMRFYRDGGANGR